MLLVSPGMVFNWFAVLVPEATVVKMPGSKLPSCNKLLELGARLLLSTPVVPVPGVVSKSLKIPEKGVLGKVLEISCALLIVVPGALAAPSIATAL